jgi:hypothetical protein
MVLMPLILPLMMSMSSRFLLSPGSKYTLGRVLMVVVYPDQMFVLGGIHQGDDTLCLRGGIIQAFNLNTLQFQDSYSSTIWSQYKVPSLVTAQIGGK